jgi:hypothetical protein
VKLDNMDKHRSLLRLERFAEVSICHSGTPWERFTAPIENGIIRLPVYSDGHMTFVAPHVTFADARTRKERQGAEWELRRFHGSVADVIRAAQAKFF